MALFIHAAGIEKKTMLAEFHDRVASLVDVNSNSASEKISRIKAAFNQTHGNEMVEYYIIKGVNGIRKSIALDRNLIYTG